MNIVDKNLSVNMYRATLDNLPDYPLPAGYQIRPFVPGDEQEWVRIESATERFIPITAEVFFKEFGTDSKLLAERQLFLVNPHGVAIGTATAWLDDNHYGQSYGRFHWLAIHPDWQGRGLSKPLLAQTCRRLRELGHDKAYLVTSTARLKAIKLYLKFGFLPEIRGAEDEQIWGQLREPLA